MLRHSEITAATVQGGPAIAGDGDKHWCCPYDAGFTSIKNAKSYGVGQGRSVMPGNVWQGQDPPSMHPLTEWYVML
jgi:hypothetical protein